MNVIKVQVIFLAFVSLFATGATSDSMMRRNLLSCFQFESSRDYIVNNRHPFEGLTFENRYGCYIGTNGWTREKFFLELDSIVSNGCSHPYTEVVLDDQTTERISSTTMGVAVACLCHADSNEWIRCAGWLLTNGIDQCANAIGKLYVRKYGLTPAAFDRYCRLMSESRVSLEKRDAVSLAAARASEKMPSTAATNGVVRLILSYGQVDPTTFSGMDDFLCAYWQGYAVSSNRYVNFQRARSQIQADYWQTGCDAVLRELEKHQPLPLLPTNTINGVSCSRLRRPPPTESRLPWARTRMATDGSPSGRAIGLSALIADQ